MGVTVDSTTLTAFMDAVTNVYGSDIWQGITSNETFYAADFASKVTQVEGVSAVYNNAGNVVYYTYGDKIVSAGATLGNEINSNVGNIAATSEINLPANTAISQGGQVAATTGMKTAASGASVATVAKNVALGVGAVAAGVQLGATIDGLLYQANPNFWDENGMSAINPQTWDSICTTDMGKTAFNFVFGIDKTTGETQAYMDEMALAYVAAYLSSKNAFDPDIEGMEIDDTTGLDMHGITQPILIGNEVSYAASGGASKTYSVSDGAIGAAFVNYDPDPSSFDTFQYVAASENPFVVTYTHDGQTEYINSIETTFNGKTFHYFGEQINYGYVDTTSGSINVTDSETGVHSKSAAYILLYGTFEQISGIQGIGQQNGATIPAVPIPTDITAALAYLQTLYPDLFDKAIYNDVVQDDGTIKRFRYVPVGLPDDLGLNETTGQLQPTGGTDLLQDQTAIDETSTETLIETLLKILNATDPNNPTQTPDQVSTEFPDTGEGTTPAIVTPTGGASALYSIYNPTQGEVNSLGAWLWSSNFVEQIKKLFNDPMQAIIGLHKVFATPPVSGRGNIKVGYLDSGVAANLVSNQYTEIDCGNVNLLEYFGNMLDYTNTDVYLYLPFVGIVPLNVVDVMRSKINVKYKVDVLTGACLALVNVYRDNNAGGQLYTYSGNCAVQYPLSSGSYMGIVSSALGIAGSVVSTIATGGAMLPVALGASATALSGAKAKVEHSGSLSGNAGAMGIKKPYLIIRRPQTKIANNFEFFDGVSNNVSGVLSSFTGYTRVKSVHLESIPATDDELTQIEELLKSGVMI